MIRILLCSEGVTDQGRDVYSEGNFTHNDGVFQVIIKKLIPGKEICFSVKKRSDIKRFALVPKPGRFTKKTEITAEKLAALAKMNDCKFIAYHRDEDNNGFSEVYTQIQSYFTVSRDIGIMCVAIVPKHMTESWLLSDAGAFPKVPYKPVLPKKPEEVWGNKDSEHHPKKYLKRVLNQFRLEPSADTYCEIAENSSVEVLKNKCPESFGQFYDDMGALMVSEDVFDLL